MDSISNWSRDSGARRRLAYLLRRTFGRPDGRELSLEDLRLRMQERGLQPRVFLEIGANDGTDTNRLLEAFPEIEIHCFEPDPRAIAAFERNVHSPRAHLHKIAIGAADATMTLYQSTGAPPGREVEFPDGYHLSGSLRAPKKHLDVHPWCKFETSIEVPVQRLDTWASKAGISAVDFIWADVQGAEIDLISGGRFTLQSTIFFCTEYALLELYEGQVSLKEIQASLPNHNLIDRFQNDALFELISGSNQ